MVSESLVGVKMLISEIAYRTPDEAAKTEKTKKQLRESVHKTFKVLDGFIQKKPFFLGDKMTYGDLQLYDLTKNGLALLHSTDRKPTTMTQPQIKLTYFDGKGRAELSRLIFSYAEIAFTDDRITHSDFAALKPTLPLGQVPVLELDGTVYGQSMAIARYAAKIAGLYPSDATEALKVDVFSCSLEDLEGPIVDFMLKTSDETEKAQKKKVFVEEMLSLADLQFLDFVDNKLKWAFPDFKVDGFPKLTALLSNVKAEPKIATYLSKHHINPLLEQLAINPSSGNLPLAFKAQTRLAMFQVNEAYASYETTHTSYLTMLYTVYTLYHVYRQKGPQWAIISF
ncbi:glutathione S-transferase, putative [Phytophthora infestans T30-4]|uniref:Glutathione S-transferase, putative n=1 Tax=Phytophthora infestans (strain T30-4) TaxID=403677 RepID=D0N357_PHYIT|nr:glutathione S-transferase, putative [Phytophthora infestans T30-4]EEY69349.1 glutathione S-transferase, putative [Phytophthora infestans T30-4]|eukprot:XP_002999203.1 glutathione S-transferase, putative [Phytophthora infestans T30-4]